MFNEIRIFNQNITYSEINDCFDIDIYYIFYEYSLISSCNYFHCRIIERYNSEILYMQDINKLNLKYYLL
jgi:hypothetical protein